MKLYFASTLLSIAVIMGAVAPSFAQKEYDDLYFNASDRKTIAYEKINEPAKATYDSKGSYKYEDESLSAKNVNPEYIAKYKAPQEEKTRKNDSYSSDEYYVEEEDRADYEGRDVRVYNNYYGSSMAPYSTFGSPFYDPFFYDPFYDPFFSPFRPYSSRFNLSIGFGFGMGWGYNSWYNRPFYGSFYDPFYGGGFYRPYGGYYNGFYDGFYTGLGYGGYPYSYYRPGNVIIVNPGESVNRGRRYTYGPSFSGRSNLNANSATDTRNRTMGVSRERRAVSNQTNTDQSVTAKSSRNGRVSTEGRTFDNTRDITTIQNDYYNRSRNNVNSNSTTRSRTYSPATQNDRSVNSDYSNRGTRSYTSRPSRSNDSYSGTRTREYSSPSRSNNSYNRSSDYSRSRSSSPSYSSPSRGSSPSYSSPSRSSSPSYSSPSRNSSSSPSRSGRRQ